MQLPLGRRSHFLHVGDVLADKIAPVTEFRSLMGAKLATRETG
jgi:hypothetical protein